MRVIQEAVREGGGEKTFSLNATPLHTFTLADQMSAEGEHMMIRRDWGSITVATPVPARRKEEC